jgi:Flp pilus assembly protein TadG
MLKKFFRDNRGAAMVEYALVALPVILFMFGIMQTAWVVWVDNLLTISVNTAARCAAIKSVTTPCPVTDWSNSNVEAGMESAANKMLGIGGATYSANTCTNGVGLIGNYTISFLFLVNMTVTAKSCYPKVSS